MIEAVNLVKDYGSIRAVDDISFQVNKGDILGFLGPNGAGKSTTMKMLTGFLPSTSGTARIGNKDIHEEPLAAKKLFGYLPENGPLYQEMTVLEILGFIAEIRDAYSPAEKSEKIERAVDICKLKEVSNQSIETLSKGFRQRVSFAQAILHDPPCLIMDEPTDGLDPNQKKQVRNLIASMATEKAIILSTHILEEVESICNRVIIIDKGKILIDEKPEEMRQRHPHYNAVEIKLRSTESAEIKKVIQAIPEVKEIKIKGEDILVIPKGGKEIINIIFDTTLKNNWPLASIEKAPILMDEIFWNLTQK
jgi:ABC-2 type transport system ATP-binding protein